MDCTTHNFGPISRTCGAAICDSCGWHKGLARCFCGWSASGGNGRSELVELGETIGDEYDEFEPDYGIDEYAEYALSGGEEW
jgi:hypothetical protein